MFEAGLRYARFEDTHASAMEIISLPCNDESILPQVIAELKSGKQLHETEAGRAVGYAAEQAYKTAGNESENEWLVAEQGDEEGFFEGTQERGFFDHKGTGGKVNRWCRRAAMGVVGSATIVLTAGVAAPVVAAAAYAHESHLQKKKKGAQVGQVGQVGQGGLVVQAVQAEQAPCEPILVADVPELDVDAAVSSFDFGSMLSVF